MKRVTGHKKNRCRMIILTLLISIIFCLSGCEEYTSPKVVHPVKIVNSEEINPTESSEKDTEEAEGLESDTEEDASDEADNATTADSDTNEDFVLLDVEDSDANATDDDGVVKTEDGKIVVDLIFFMGQSNMSGAGGDASIAPYVPEGNGYEFRSVSDPTKLYPIEEPFGKNESFIGGICDLPGAKKGSIVSAFVNEYYAKTGIPVVAVSASQGASTTEIWQTAGFQADMEERYKRSVVWLESSGYYIRNRYAVWFQGESDAANHVSPDVYRTNMDNIIRPMFVAGLNKVFIITPGRTLSIKNYFSDIVQEQLDMCKESGYYALGTNLLSAVSTEYMVDEWHYDQRALNLIGIETARSVAYYTINKKERLDYDYLNKKTYVPDGNDYTGEEVVEPLALSNIQKILDDYYYADENTEDSEN